MNDISATLKTAYNADAVVVIPGGGTFGMESIARQFAGEQPVIIVRNGWFSFLGLETLEKGKIAASIKVLSARCQASDLGSN